MSRMWWTSNERSRGWSMLAWDRMCYPKGMGGLGFGVLRLFNLALLSRQVWRLTQFKDTLCYKNFEKKCPRCGAKEETLIHALKDCPSARAILTLGGFDNLLLVGDYSCCIDWLEDVLRVLDLKAAADFFTTL
ncbi:hypothetical protein PVK06_007509 [Gossypium arboreum]|uniref:Reverse transcriptase n=1 Tax=Gossypium arboreum TaxID=29729 RepID=A0ABR0QHL6_GOSAR|nr:hypothetical protein PVK06_007509 [Gossypium arboreum]